MDVSKCICGNCIKTMLRFRIVFEEYPISVWDGKCMLCSGEENLSYVEGAAVVSNDGDIVVTPNIVIVNEED